MKITILWTRLANYSWSFFRSLAIDYNCQIQLVYYPTDAEAPYKDFDLSFCKQVIINDSKSQKQVKEQVLAFQPSTVLMASWNFPFYMRLCKYLKKQGSIIVSATDNQWHGTWKQWLGVAVSPWFLKPCINIFLVPGDRQSYFVQKLGFTDIMQGWYAATVDLFQGGPDIQQREDAFVFVGRLIPIKGIEILVEAYQKYRKLVEEPWNLVVAGTGSLQSKFDGLPGVECLGFMQPNHLSTVMHRGKCLVLPSFSEPWGVVIQEAAAAGLPIICSSQCGAVTAYVRDGLNGYVIHPDVETLCNAMLRIHRKTDEQVQRMSQASIQLGCSWTPQQLAEHFLDTLRSKSLTSSAKPTHIDAVQV
jgi:glycosyltransferase involved in cell wall biosynthesis